MQTWQLSKSVFYFYHNCKYLIGNSVVENVIGSVRYKKRALVDVLGGKMSEHNYFALLATIYQWQYLHLTG